MLNLESSSTRDLHPQHTDPDFPNISLPFLVLCQYDAPILRLREGVATMGLPLTRGNPTTFKHLRASNRAPLAIVPFGYLHAVPVSGFVS
jgi:hypothetical protein